MMTPCVGNLSGLQRAKTVFRGATRLTRLPYLCSPCRLLVRELLHEQAAVNS